MPKNSYLLTAFSEHPWAILPKKLAVLHQIVLRHASGENVEPLEVQAQIHGGERPEMRLLSDAGQSGDSVEKRIAVLPLFGTIFPRANLMTSLSGATSAEDLGKQFQVLVDDPQIDAILLDVNSPGGYSAGIEELSDRIYSARGQKPIVAISNHMMASAAFWVASAADEVVVTPSGDVGSVGVFAVHEDYSKALEQDGVTVSLISAGKYKVEGNPYQPLGEEARAAIQSAVDDTYQAFLGALARNRGASVEKVEKDFGQGRLLNAKDAVDAGMADRVSTFRETLASLFNSISPVAGEMIHTNGSIPYVNSPDGLAVASPTEGTEPVVETPGNELDEETERQAVRLREDIQDFQKRSKEWI